MKKIPTLFKRVYDGHKIVDILDEITPGCEEAFLHGKATIKYDGACCAIIDGVFYKRYDAKKGKTPPAGAIPCCDPDPVTGHWPHWVMVNKDKPEDKWFIEAFKRTIINYDPEKLKGIRTYEAVGAHFNGNPYGFNIDFLVRHGSLVVDLPRNFEDIKYYLAHNRVEGIVFWLNGEPVCKIKRTDFGLEWPICMDEFIIANRKEELK